MDNAHEPVRRTGRRALATALAAATLALAPTGPALGAGLLIADGGLGGRLELTEHRVTVTINNSIAVTELHQTFLNTENRQVEALYTFPVPKQASVADFSMWINGTEMVGEVLEKKRARQIYESYKQTRKDPGLLEQVDHKTFEMRIFPINAGAEQRVRLVYYQHLETDHDWTTYTYPLATATRPGIDTRVNGTFAIDVRVLSEIPISEMTSPSHGADAVISPHTPTMNEASLEQQEGRLARDFVLAYQTSRPNTGIDVITSRPKGEDGYFMLSLTAGKELENLRDPMDYVFVLDISGSMANDGKLLISKEAIEAFIDELQPEDRFEIITFNVRPETLFAGLRHADDDANQQARRFLDEQRSRGGTALLPALQTASKYGDPDRRLNVVILSDGMTEQQDRTALLQAGRQRPQHATLFAIGVGNEVNRPLLGQLAEEAGGLAAFLSRGDDFKRQAQAFRRKLTRPAASDLEITINGVETYDIEPITLPNLYHGSPVTIFGRYRNAGTATAVVSADVMGRAISKSVNVQLPRTDAGNPEIERMWALKRVQRLLREADRAGSRSPVIDEIIRLGEAYSIATEYTSFIVLENDAEYQRWSINRRNATRLARDRDAARKLDEQLRTMRDRALAQLGPAPQSRGSDATPSPTFKAQTSTPARPGDISLRNNDSRTSGGRQGAGAIDPFTGLIVLALGAAALPRRNRREPDA